MNRQGALATAVAVIAFGMLAACSPVARPASGLTTAGASRSATVLPAGAPFDYQLGGAYTPPPGTALVVRDSTASPAAGLYNVCYVNGFQTQPGKRASWLKHRRDLVLSGPDGQPLSDPNWPGELILDTSTEAKRQRLARIVGETVKLCAQKGFQAVEIDNLDSFARSRGALSVDHNLALAADLARIAHADGMLIAQKNAAELSASGKQAGFDFAIAEECAQFRECDSYTDVYGNRVIDIEYTDNLDADFARICDRTGTPKATILRDRELVSPEDPPYVYRRC